MCDQNQKTCLPLNDAIEVHPMGVALQILSTAKAERLTTVLHDRPRRNIGTILTA